jgi:peptide/nickel transport system substrate-binding protein
MHTKNFALITTLLLVLVVMVSACSPAAAPTPVATQAPPPTEAPAATQPPAPTEAPAVPPTAAPTQPPAETRGILKYNAGLDYGGKENLDPTDPNRFYPLIALLFDRLTEPTGNKLDPSPSLAESWEANATNDVWTFHLRKDAFFHDGKPVTSADVAYSADHWKNGKESVLASTFSDVTSVETPDDFTVVFHLSKPNAFFLMLTMDYRARILPKDGLPGILTTGIGSGPYKLEKLDVGGVTKVVANDKYWGGPPGLAGIDIYQIADAQASLQALQSGQLDFGQVQPPEAELFKGNSNVVVKQIPTGNWSGFVMRTDIPPFNNLALRQAMHLVVDRQEMLNLAYNGVGTLSCDTAVMPGDPYQLTMDECTNWKQDIEAAKAKLVEAGYPNGFEIDLYTSDMVAEWTPMAEVFQQQAQLAGIKVNIVTAPAAGFYSDTWMVKPFVMTNWNERSAVQALNEIYRGGGSWNESYWNVPAYDALLDKAASESNFDARRQDYLDAQKMLHEEGGTIIPFFTNVVRVDKVCVQSIPEMGLMQFVWAHITKSPDCP